MVPNTTRAAATPNTRKRNCRLEPMIQRNIFLTLRPCLDEFAYAPLFLEDLGAVQHCRADGDYRGADGRALGQDRQIASDALLADALAVECQRFRVDVRPGGALPVVVNGPVGHDLLIFAAARELQLDAHPIVHRQAVILAGHHVVQRQHRALHVFEGRHPGWARQYLAAELVARGERQDARRLVLRQPVPLSRGQRHEHPELSGGRCLGQHGLRLERSRDLPEPPEYAAGRLRHGPLLQLRHDQPADHLPAKDRLLAHLAGLDSQPFGRLRAQNDALGGTPGDALERDRSALAGRLRSSRIGGARRGRRQAQCRRQGYQPALKRLIRPYGGICFHLSTSRNFVSNSGSLSYSAGTTPSLPMMRKTPTYLPSAALFAPARTCAPGLIRLLFPSDILWTGALRGTSTSVSS